METFAGDVVSKWKVFRGDADICYAKMHLEGGWRRDILQFNANNVDGQLVDETGIFMFYSWLVVNRKAKLGSGRCIISSHIFRARITHFYFCF